MTTTVAQPPPRNDCTCKSHDVTGVHTVRQLMDAGHTQRIASLAVWGWDAWLVDLQQLTDTIAAATAAVEDLLAAYDQPAAAAA